LKKVFLDFKKMKIFVFLKIEKSAEFLSTAEREI